MNLISGDTMHSTTVTNTISPSFTAHSSNNLADVAARVVEEFRHQNGCEYDDIFNDYDEFSVTADENSDAVIRQEKLTDNDHQHEHEHDDDEFEFAVVCNDVNNSSSVSADEMFSQGHILPRYPLFDRSLLLDVDPNLTNAVNDTTETVTVTKPSALAVRLPLRKLFSEERDFCSSSSSEADDLDGITPGTYCVWKPKTQPPDQRCKKSNSTGNSSRRWKFRDILYRSNSDGKESPFLFFKPSIGTNKKINNDKVKHVAKRATVGDGASAVTTEKIDPANNENRGDRRQSVQALATAFTTVSRSNRTLHLF